MIKYIAIIFETAIFASTSAFLISLIIIELLFLLQQYSLPLLLTFIGLLLVTFFFLIINGLSFLAVHFQSKRNLSNQKIALIFAPSTLTSLFQIYSSGIFWLVWSLIKTKKAYSVYFVDSERAFEELLLNHKIKIIYIFGHGTKYGVWLSKHSNSFYAYRKLTGKLKQKKEFVAQLHCNHEVKIATNIHHKSLGRAFAYNSYVTDHYLRGYVVWEYLFKTWKKGSYIAN